MVEAQVWTLSCLGSVWNGTVKYGKCSTKGQYSTREAVWWRHDVAAAGEGKDEYGEMTDTRWTSGFCSWWRPGTARANTVQEPAAINRLCNAVIIALAYDIQWQCLAAMSQEPKCRGHAAWPRHRIRTIAAPSSPIHLHNESLHNHISCLTSVAKAISQPGFGRVCSRSSVVGSLCDLVYRSGLVNAM